MTATHRTLRHRWPSVKTSDYDEELMQPNCRIFYGRPQVGNAPNDGADGTSTPHRRGARARYVAPKASERGGAQRGCHRWGAARSALFDQNEPGANPDVVAQIALQVCPTPPCGKDRS